MFPDSVNRKELGRYLALGQVGMEMVVPVGIGLVLDHFFGWSPWGVVVGAVVGLVGGLAHLVQIVNREEPASPAKPPPDSERR